MPAMASLTVKKADTTTDIVYDALAGSPGDGTPAYWRQDTGATAGLPVGHRPFFKFGSKWNGNKTARQMTFEFVYPYALLNSTTNEYTVKDRCVMTGIMTTPAAIPIGYINEFVHQGLNLLSQTLIKASASAGFAPT